jgi:hypothetical protein
MVSATGRLDSEMMVGCTGVGMLERGHWIHQYIIWLLKCEMYLVSMSLVYRSDVG